MLYTLGTKSMTTPIKVRWLIAHKPVELFVRTAEAFRTELNARLPGQFDIEIVTVPDYIAQHKDAEALGMLVGKANTDGKSFKVAQNALFDALHSDIQMSQTQVSVVGSKDPIFNILDLPFLFDDHAHVSRVLEGEIGKEICNSLESTTDLKGLGFTYSGGYRVVGSNHKIADLADLATQKVLVTQKGPRSQTFEAIGVEPILFNPTLWSDDLVPGEGVADAIETTYLRFNGTHVLKTNHSIFMTTILTSKEFWAGLTEEQQQAFTECATITSRIEREWAIQEAEEFEEQCASKGVEITDLSDTDQATLKHKARYVYLNVDTAYADLVKRIRTA
jgi:TRAP-type C4-dicarboxylate transport system substrate-binding protein